MAVNCNNCTNETSDEYHMNYASSEEFVGSHRDRQGPKRMIQSDFSRMIGPKTIGFSGGQFRFGVETLNNSTGKLLFGPKPVQQQGAMTSQHPGYLFHWINLRTHCLGTPFVQELSGPIGRGVFPEELKLFFQEVTPDRLQIVMQQFRQLALLPVRQVLRALEQQPAAFTQHRLIALALERSGFMGTNFIYRFAHMRHNVEPVQDIQCGPGLLGNHFQIRPPHVRADESQFQAPFPAKPAEETQQGLDRAPLTDPQQAFAVSVDLVDQRQITVTPLPGDLVNPNGLDTRQVLVCPSPGDGSLNRAEHVVPARAKRHGHLFPAQSLRPACQKPGIGIGQVVFPDHPRHPLNPDTTGGTVNPAGCVDEKHLVSPHRDELETSSTQPVIARPAPATTRTLGTAIAARSQFNFKRGLLGLFDPADRFVHKGFEFLHAIKDSLDLHPVPFALLDGGFALPSSQSRGQDALPFNSLNSTQIG